MVKRLKQVDEKLSNAQTNKPCLICQKGGRTVGRLGTIELNYCGKHRKYGERVLNFLVNAVFRDKLKDFLNEAKHDLFMDNLPELSEESNEKLAKYVDDNIKKIDELKEWHEKTK